MGAVAINKDENISSKQSDTLTGGGLDDASMGTNETLDSFGSKRKRVRHRKKKNANDENQMNLPNVGAGAAAAPPSQKNGTVKRDTAPVKSSFEKPQSKGNTHVR